MVTIWRYLIGQMIGVTKNAGYNAKASKTSAALVTKRTDSDWWKFRYHPIELHIGTKWFKGCQIQRKQLYRLEDFLKQHFV